MTAAHFYCGRQNTLPRQIRCSGSELFPAAYFDRCRRCIHRRRGPANPEKRGLSFISSTERRHVSCVGDRSKPRRPLVRAGVCCLVRGPANPKSGGPVDPLASHSSRTGSKSPIRFFGCGRPRGQGQQILKEVLGQSIRRRHGNEARASSGHQLHGRCFTNWPYGSATATRITVGSL